MINGMIDGMGDYHDLFEVPIYSKRVRKGITAFKYRNGVIVINGQQFVMYSMTDAIKRFREKFPLRKRQN